MNTVVTSPPALYQNPPSSHVSSSPISPLRSPFSYFNPVILFCVRCIVTPMCEMFFAACWMLLLILLPNQRSFFKKQKFSLTVTPLRCFMLKFGSGFAHWRENWNLCIHPPSVIICYVLSYEAIFSSMYISTLRTGILNYQRGEKQLIRESWTHILINVMWKILHVSALTPKCKCF